MTPRQLLAHARGLISQRDAATEGVWPRCVAFLARGALESSVTSFVDRHAPGLRDTPMRAQLIALTALSNRPELARRVVYAWHALSEATHYHAYELAPAVAELEAWLDTVGAFIDAVSPVAPTADARGAES